MNNMLEVSRSIGHARVAVPISLLNPMALVEPDTFRGITNPRLDCQSLHLVACGTVDGVDPGPGIARRVPDMPTREVKPRPHHPHG